MKRAILVVAAVIALAGCTRKEHTYLTVNAEYCSVQNTGKTKTETSYICVAQNNNACAYMMPTYSEYHEVEIKCEYKEWR